MVYYGLYFLNLAILHSVSSSYRHLPHPPNQRFKQKDLMNDVFDEAMHFLFRVHLLLSQQLLSPVDRDVRIAWGRLGRSKIHGFKRTVEVGR